jgi:hypothetical protein
MTKSVPMLDDRGRAVEHTPSFLRSTWLTTARREIDSLRFSPPSPRPKVRTRSSAALTVNMAVPRIILQGT